MRSLRESAPSAESMRSTLVRCDCELSIALNPTPGSNTPGSKSTASDPAVERAFVAALETRGIPTTVRDTRGREIGGAGGQLAATVVAE